MRMRYFIVLVVWVCAACSEPPSSSAPAPVAESDEQKGQPGNAGDEEAASVVSEESPPQAPKSRAIEAWKAFMAAGCDGAKAGIWTPVQARILREAPRAMGNGPISDSRIQTFYAQDHEGYDGSHLGLLGLEREVAICMAKMEGWEALLRESHGWPISEAVQGRLLQDPAAFRGLMDFGLKHETYPFQDVTGGVDDDGLIWFRADGVGCEPEEGSAEGSCRVLEIQCRSTGNCEVSFPSGGGR